jgi:hypothetical protein
MSKSYDLSTSSKWSALSDGEHTVQIVAKGTGYRDSAKSTSVTVTKGGSTGETWLLNYSIQPGSQSYNFTGISFTSNNQNFDRIYYNRQSVDEGTLSYSINGTEKEVYYFNDYSDNWLDGEAYRTITFDSPVTNTSLLAWLQANGTKQGGATLINFTIGSTSYQAEEGMTWQQWVDSSYNTSNGVYFISDGYLKWTNGSVYGPTATSSSTNPKATDTPQANGVYTAKAGGGGSQ